MSSLNGLDARTVAVWTGKVRLRVLSKGAGPALLIDRKSVV